MVLEERVEELASPVEKPNDDVQLLKTTADGNVPLGASMVDSSVFTTLSLMSSTEISHDNTKNDKSDYNWLLSPPDSPVLKMESQKSTMSQFLDSCSLSTMTSMPRNVRIEPLVRSTTVTKQNSNSPSELNSSSMGNAKSLSGGTKPINRRAATPTGRPKISAMTKPSRSSTPSRVNVSSTKPLVPTAIPSSAKVTRRSSTPTGRSSLPNKSSNSRSATPTQRSATASGKTASAPQVRSSSTLRSGAATSNTSMNSGPTSLTVRSTSSKNNMKSSVPERPASASRIRPGVPVSQFSSRKSITPARGRAPNGNGNTNSKDAEFVVKRNRGRSNGGDDVNPVVIGSEMVERIVNMRKLAPPNKGNNSLTHDDDAKKHSVESSGFGRSLSSKSLDMALRHMDITRSIAGKPRPRVPIVSMATTCSVRFGPSQSESSGMDSSLATNSNANSEISLTGDSLSK